LAACPPQEERGEITSPPLAGGVRGGGWDHKFSVGFGGTFDPSLCLTNQDKEKRRTKAMKKRTGIWALLVLTLLLMANAGAYGQPGTGEDKTLSPFFFVKSDDPELDRLPLKSTSAHVRIAGVIADVAVTQVYKNEGKRPIEAIYIFPASTRAAVYSMKMTIGERTLIAKIAKREEARREYEEAKQTGRSASLLEQQRPNGFQMNVANILPGDVIHVEMKYTELLVPTDAVYEFIYPTVVGPRYSNHETASRDQWLANPYLQEGELPADPFDMKVDLAAGMPVQNITCSSHKVAVKYSGPTSASITLDPSEKNGATRDFILKYRLAGNRIETGLLLYKGAEENFFLLMLQPPKKPAEREILPREYIFIVDVSGSMHGFPLDMSKKLLKDLIGHLRTGDKFNVLLFAGGSSLMSEESLAASPDNIQRALTLIERQRGGGGTELLPALKRALAIPRAEGFSRTVVIATDGYVAVEEKAFDLIRSNLGDANVFTFGIGSAVNRHLIEGMARVGMGEPFVIAKAEEAPEKAKKFRQLILSPVLTRVKVDFQGFEAYDVEPPSVPDVLADRPITVFGKWRGNPSGSIRITGLSGTHPYDAKVQVEKVVPLGSNSALRYLWARHRISLLSDYTLLRPNDERVKEVTSLGLTYNLLTATTSFVALDSQVRFVDGQAVTVRQPLPLPQGVSNYAVGERSKLAAPASAAFGFVQANRHYSKNAADKQEAPADESKIAEEKSDQKAIRLRKIEVNGNLSETLVRSAVMKKMDAIELCLRKAGVEKSSPKGKEVFTLLVGPDGRVKEGRVEKGTMISEDLSRCILEILKAVRFSADSGRGDVTLRLTFSLG
jgi:Ca-activated chloride channel family protein